MISDLYLKRALKIRKEYLIIKNDINRYEQIAKDLIISLDKSKDGFKELLESLKSSKITNPEVAKQKLESLVLNTENDMNKVESSVNELNKKIDKLRDDEINLYKEITRTYTDLNTEEIKKEIQEYIKDNLS